jgi:hypothetical protein
MIDAEERTDVSPICPHCKSEISKLWYRGVSGLLGRRYVYFCSQCRAILGVSHRKGFWMG